MDAGFGGPVWHASIASHGRNGRPESMVTDEHWQRAYCALANVGQPDLGEWKETGEVACHLRRRVTAEEWKNRPWGMDLRHTPEGQKRLAAPGASASPEEW